MKRCRDLLLCGGIVHIKRRKVNSLNSSCTGIYKVLKLGIGVLLHKKHKRYGLSFVHKLPYSPLIEDQIIVIVELVLISACIGKYVGSNTRCRIAACPKQP